MNKQPTATNLANTAVDTEKTVETEQQPTPKSKFDEIEKSLLLDKAVKLATQLDIAKYFCQSEISLDMADCIHVAEVLENNLLLNLDCTKPLTLEELNQLIAVSRAAKLFAKTAADKINVLTDALHSKDFSKVKEIMPYVKD